MGHFDMTPGEYSRHAGNEPDDYIDELTAIRAELEEAKKVIAKGEYKADSETIAMCTERVNEAQKGMNHYFNKCQNLQAENARLQGIIDGGEWGIKIGKSSVYYREDKSAVIDYYNWGKNLYDYQLVRIIKADNIKTETT